MADKTPFADLVRLDPQDPLSTDGFAFQSLNPLITDRLLRVGARDHRHDGHAPLDNPTEEPVVDLAATSGTIGPGEEVAVTYTLVDIYGGETLGAPVGTYSTPDPIDPPSTEPEVAVEAVGGAILPGPVFYAMTYTDALGGETDIGVPVEVDVEPGSSTNKITLSGLSAIVAEAPGATGWRLYKSTGVSRYHFLASGSSSQDQVIDDGNLCVDCTEVPPTENNTLGFNAITVQVPDTALNNQAGAVAYRLYVALGGDFESPALLDQQLAATLGQVFTYDTLATETGRPPDVASSLAGAAKINPDTDILDWHFKRPVQTFGDLPVGEQGDMRVTLEDGRLWVVLGLDGAEGPTDWTQIRGDGSSSGVGHDIWQAGVPMPDRGILDFQGTAVSVTDDAATGRTIVNIEGGGGGGGASYPGGIFERAAENLAIPDTNAVTDSGALAVTDSVVIGEDTSFPELELWLQHPAPSQLRGWLVGPDNVEYQFISYSTGASGLGSDFAANRCVITPDTTKSITEAASMAVGRYRPDGDWQAMVGKNILGDWKIRLRDSFSGSVGTLKGWGLRFTSGSPDQDDVAVNTKAELEFREGSAEGPMRASIVARPMVEEITPIEGYYLGAWPDADYFQDELNWTQFGVSGGALAPTTTDEKRVIYTGYQDGGRWQDDFEWTARFDILAGHAGDWGNFALGFKDELGNMAFASLGTDQAGLRIYRKLPTDANPVLHSNGTAGLPPEGPVWLRFGRKGDMFYAEEWRTDPAIAGAYFARREWLMNSTYTEIFGKGLGKPGRPWMRFRPGVVGGVTYLGGGPGLNVVARPIIPGTFGLWMYRVDEDGYRLAEPLFTPTPDAPTELALDAGVGGVLKVYKDGRNAYLEGQITVDVTTNPAFFLAGDNKLPVEFRPKAGSVRVPAFVQKNGAGAFTNEIIEIDVTGELYRMQPTALSAGEYLIVFLDGVGWRIV